MKENISDMHRQVGYCRWVLAALLRLSCVTSPPCPHTHTHTYSTAHSSTLSYQSTLTHRCSAWLVAISAPICFTLHLQTNILMDKGRVTWLNFTQSYCVSDVLQYTSVEETGLWAHWNEFNSIVCRNVCAYMAEKTCVKVCMQQHFLWCESVQHVLCSDVQSAELTC